MVYSIGNGNSPGNINKKHNEILEDLFGLGNNSSPAQLLEYKEINHTIYILDMKNATRPYMISFAESYDPLWRAYTNVDENNNDNSGNSGNSIITNQYCSAI